MPLAEENVRLSRSRFRLLLQREIGRWLGPIWIPIVALLLVLSYRMEGLETVRREYRRIRRETRGPLLLCANHLTLIDSAIVAWALGSPWWYVTHYSALPWNLPEQRNFGATWLSRSLSYLMKCLPIVRGGDRRDVARVLDDFVYFLSRGETGLVFPEGGRSRSGRVEIDSAAHGVGRVVSALPGCRVLCVYLRGDHQETYTDMPARRERFHVELSCLEPRTKARGLRGSLDIARQITARLAEMEQRYFDARK